MSAGRGALSPLAAYERSERQKAAVAATFRARIVRLHGALRTLGVGAARRRLRPSERGFAEAAREFADVPPCEPETILAAYRDLAMRRGARRIDPEAPDFARRLRAFHRAYVSNFPIREEQESRDGFRSLWTAGTGEGGYRELAFSVRCPLTGNYLMGVNFTVQPRSGSAHFIYGFVNPAARGLGGLAAAMIGLIRTEARAAMDARFLDHPDDRPAFDWDGDPLILFEKNMVDRMTLTDILLDTAGIDIRNPPARRSRLVKSSMSPNMRDLIWDRRGGRIVDYHYCQSSLDGATIVEPGDEASVTALLNGEPQAQADARSARAALDAALGEQVPGCEVLNLCAFAADGAEPPVAQISDHNRVFQGTSVIKDPQAIGSDIYFRAQTADLERRGRDGRIALKPIPPFGGATFEDAERTLKRLLAGLDWATLREHRDRTYADWIAALPPE